MSQNLINWLNGLAALANLIMMVWHCIVCKRKAHSPWGWRK